MYLLTINNHRVKFNDDDINKFNGYDLIEKGNSIVARDKETKEIKSIRDILGKTISRIDTSKLNYTYKNCYMSIRLITRQYKKHTIYYIVSYKQNGKTKNISVHKYLYAEQIRYCIRKIMGSPSTYNEEIIKIKDILKRDKIEYKNNKQKILDRNRTKKIKAKKEEIKINSKYYSIAKRGKLRYRIIHPITKETVKEVGDKKTAIIIRNCICHLNGIKRKETFMGMSIEEQLKIYHNIMEPNNKYTRLLHSNGELGLSYKKDKDRWDVNIKINGHKIHIGSSKDKSIALCMYNLYTIKNNIFKTETHDMGMSIKEQENYLLSKGYIEKEIGIYRKK